MMRWLITVAVFVLAAPAQAQEGEAEKLFRQVDKKLTSAKTIKVAFDGELGWSGKVVISFKGTLLVGEGDKFFVETERSGLGDKERTLLVGDGVKVVEKNLTKPQPTTKESPKNLGAYIRGALVRSGLEMSVDLQAPTPRPKAEDYWKTGNFKFVERDKNDNPQTQAIDFTLTWDQTKTANMRLWIDLNTKLPVKLQLTRDQDGGSLVLIEYYREFTVSDDKVDAKQFELPK
jgi:outer membrane lipoprotein-sorting protein